MAEKFDVGERVFVSFWANGTLGVDPAIHKEDLYWVRGTITGSGDVDPKLGKNVVFNGATVGWMTLFEVRLDRRFKWYQVFKPTVQVPAYKLRKLSALDLLSEV